MKKGFTLVEIMAVILILGVILVIAIPTFNKVVEESKNKLYKNLNDTVVKTTKTYATENAFLMPTEEGESVEVTVNELISTGYLKELKNPGDKEDTCNGYVIITRLADEQYAYNPHINCSTDIASSTEDALVLHYTFDDFQEPTTNLVARPEFSSTSMGYPWGSWSPAVLTFGTANLLGYDTNYTNITKEADGSVNAIHQAIGSLTIGSSYTLSFYVRISPNSASTTGTIRAYINDGYVNYSITKEWIRVSLTRTATAASHTIHITQYNAAYDVQVAHVQFEKKAYSTPFVNGVRTGIVKDYSVNNVEASLTEIKTPKWVYDQYRASGVYEFKGTNQINTGYSFVGKTNYTMSVWINKYDTFPVNKYDKFIGTQDWGIGRVGIMTNSSKFLCVNTYFGSGYDYWIQSTVMSESNKWFHFAAVFDRNGYEEIFYNGELIGSRDMSGASTINWSSDTITIASGTVNDLYYIPHYGKMDDFRIYNRVLNAEEIKFIYEMTK